jgi:hypothetical protein
LESVFALRVRVWCNEWRVSVCIEPESSSRLSVDTDSE